MEEVDSNFLSNHCEKEELNQYWYSQPTIEVIVKEVLENGSNSTAFISTPSLYFSLPVDARQGCKVLDLDDQWASDDGFVLFDFNRWEEIPENLHNSFDMVVIDPPFITRDVWEKYAQAAKSLLKKTENGDIAGKIILTTIQENKEMMYELLKVEPKEFLPSIPNLVYQYSLYTNYESDQLMEQNPEIPC